MTVNSSNEVAFKSDTKYAGIGPGRRALWVRLFVLALCLLLLYAVAMWLVVTVPIAMYRPTNLTMRFHDQTRCVFDEQTESIVFFTRHNGTLRNATVLSVDTRKGRLYREAWQDTVVSFNCELGTLECMSFQSNKVDVQAGSIKVRLRARTLPELEKVGAEIETSVEHDITYWRSLFLRFHGNQLTVEEPVSRETIRKLVLADDASSPAISLLDGSPLILVTFTNSVTGPPQNSGPLIQEHRLLSLEGPTLKEVFRWTGPWFGSYSNLQLSGKAFATLDKSGEILDVISLEDFTLIRQIKGLGANRIHVGDSWYQDYNGGYQFFDLLTDELLPVDSNEAILARDAAQGRIAKAFNDGGTKGPALLIDETSGETLAKLPRDTQMAWFVADGKELLAATWSGRVLRYDALTGKLLKVIDPFAYARWSWLPMCLLFLLWVRAWLKTAARLYDHAWIDMAIVTGVIVSLALMRPYFAGDPTNTQHFPYRIGQGVFAGWMFLASMWLAMGRTRFSLRLAAPLVCMSLVALLALIAIGNTEPAFWGLIYGGTILSVVGALSWYYLQGRGWRLLVTAPIHAAAHRALAADSDGSQGQTKVRLGDLFILTGVIAGLVAVLRWAPGFANLSPSIVPHLMDAVLVVSFLAIGVAAAFAALCNHDGHRTEIFKMLLIVLLATGLNYILDLAHFGRNGEPGWQPDLARYQLLPFLLSAFTVYVGLLGYRTRGWRLMRVQNG